MIVLIKVLVRSGYGQIQIKLKYCKVDLMVIKVWQVRTIAIILAWKLGSLYYQYYSPRFLVWKDEMVCFK